MSKLVITGGLGHIGSALLHDYRIREFDEVVVIDNLRTQRYCSLFHLKHPVKFVEADVTETLDLDWFEGADAVIHLAAVVNAGETIDKDDETRRINFEGATNVAAAINSIGVPRAVQMSTTSVYGPGSAERRTEDSDELNPQTPYAVWKLASEDSFLGDGRWVLRAGTAYGISPGVRFYTVTNKFIWQAVTGQPLTIWGEGTGARPYASLSHIKDALFRLVSRTAEPPWPGFYNIVSHHWCPNELVEILSQFMSVKVDYVTPRIINQDAYLIACDKATEAGLYHTSKDIATTQLEEYIVELSKYVLAGVTPWSTKTSL